MIVNSRLTMYGRILINSLLTGKQYKPLPNTTLNEKFGIETDKILTTNPIINYYCIGVGGNDVITGNSGYSYSTHGVMDASLYKLVPFVMVKINEDLTNEEQSKYKFKVKEMYNGEEYYCYYLKKIDTINHSNNVFKISTTTSKSANRLSILDTNTDKYLNPIPNDRNIKNVDLNSNNMVANNTKLEFSLFKQDIKNINDAISIKYGDGYKLTEIGVCSSVETNYEPLAVQICYHVNIDLDTSITLNLENNISRNIEIGGCEILR